MDPLKVMLRRVARRLAFHQWVVFTATMLFYSSCVALTWVVLTRLFPMLGDALWVSVGVLGAGVLGALVWTWRRRPSLVRAALETDRRLGLGERLTSSLELKDVQSPMVEALHADARRRLDGLSFREQFPLRIRGLARWSFVPLLALGLAYVFLPTYDLLGHRERIAEAKAKEQARVVQAERLEAAKQSIEKDAAGADAVDAEILASIDAMAAELGTGQITEKQAFAKLSNVVEAIEKQRAELAAKDPIPQLQGDMNQFDAARDMAMAMQEGRMDDAAKKAAEIAKKLHDKNLSEADKKKLAKEMNALSKLAGGRNSELGKALAKAAAALGEGNPEDAAKALEELALSLEDIQSILDQMNQLAEMKAKLGEWKNSMLGPSEFCRYCGTKLGECEGGSCDKPGGHTHHGACARCVGGAGLRGPGQGAGGILGELPEIDTAFKPSVAGGPMTKGRMLADIIQRTAPEQGQQPTVENLSGAFVQVQQEAEQALTQEEIPIASKEYVRRYFGSLEPEKP